MGRASTGGVGLWGAGLIAGSIAALVTAAGSLGALGLVGSTLPDAVTAGGAVTDALGYGFAITLLAAAACGDAERCERDGVRPRRCEIAVVFGGE